MQSTDHALKRRAGWWRWFNSLTESQRDSLVDTLREGTMRMTFEQRSAASKKGHATKKALGLYHGGWTLSDVTKQKMRDAKAGKPKTAEHRANMSASAKRRQERIRAEKDSA